MTPRRRRGGEMATHRIEISDCPCCGYRFEASTNQRGDDPPACGDFSICAGCAEVLRFTPALQLRVMTTADWQVVRDDPAVDEALRQAQARVRDGSWRRRGGDR
jgi:hypothetical protein